LSCGIFLGGAELTRRQNGGAADPLRVKAKGAAVDADFFRSFKNVWQARRRSSDSRVSG
jgi:hypothetical protein